MLRTPALWISDNRQQNTITQGAPLARHRCTSINPPG